MTTEMERFIHGLPKAELHVHLEGTLEAEMRFALAERNGVDTGFDTIEALRESYVFHDLPSFLQVFYDGAFVMLKAQDFSDLCYAYLERVAAQNVLYSEMFFDPQQHTDRGVPFEVVIEGLTDGRKRAEDAFGIKSALILCFVRERSADSAMQTLEWAIPHRDRIVGLGLDSDENGNPPSKFADHFARARAEGFHLTMHCDLDIPGTHEHIRQVIEDIEVDRIDHGANILERPDLIEKTKARNLHFTICPTANTMIRGPHEQDVVRRSMEHGLHFSLNSDDPAYFGRDYMNGTFEITQAEAGLTRNDLITVSRHAFEAAWVDADLRNGFLRELDAYASATA
ncbi:adenosine deaminase [Jannaschia sp. LMIT008]|uniref:adenosine deaminase n=1 Tax=Jannaschia maritima TaxID=3032585 RepID=UPI002810B209|nr:adenosine deaminase [Jannaschia sp. LMIT008]